jgi:hypothetical protein
MLRAIDRGPDVEGVWVILDTQINRLGGLTLALNQADELLQFAFVEVGDDPERHP